MRHHIIRRIVSHRTAVRLSQHLVVTSIALSYRPLSRRHIVPSYCRVCRRSTGFTSYHHTVRSHRIVDCIVIPSVVTLSHVIIPCQEETRLLCKMSPTSHFFFFEKVEKNNDNKSVHSCQRNTSGKLSVSLLVPDVFSRNRTVVYAIACDCMRSHAIACHRMRSHAMVSYHCKILSAYRV